MAAETHESIPPLRSTTACLWILPIKPSYSLLLDALGSRIPNEFMKLQPEAHRQSVRKNPFHQNARQQTPPFPFRVVKYRGKQHGAHFLGELMLQGKVACKFVIPPRGKDKLHFIVSADGVEILHLEGIRFSGVR